MAPKTNLSTEEALVMYTRKVLHREPVNMDYFKDRMTAEGYIEFTRLAPVMDRLSK